VNLKELLTHYGIEEIDEICAATNYHRNHTFEAGSMRDRVQFQAWVTVLRLLTEDDKNRIIIVDETSRVSDIVNAVWILESDMSRRVMDECARILFPLTKSGLVDAHIIVGPRFLGFKENK